MIVEGTLAHLDDLVELFDRYRVFYRKESDTKGAREFLTERLQHEESVVYLFYKDDIAAGFTQLYPKYSSARMVQNWILNDLFVKEEYRKFGIGEQLISRAFEFAKSKGAAFVQLETQVENVNAQRLYERLNFELQGPSFCCIRGTCRKEKLVSSAIRYFLSSIQITF